MLLLIPPDSRISNGADDPPQPVRRLLVRILASLATVAVTAWVCTFGWIPAILSLLIAKHVLVAIVLMDLGVDRRRC